MKRDPTWICLPPEARPEWWRNNCLDRRRTVCLLRKGAIRSSGRGDLLGTNMQAQVISVGIVTIGLEYPNCDYHPKLLLMLLIYVDGFKMALLRPNISVGEKL